MSKELLEEIKESVKVDIVDLVYSKNSDGPTEHWVKSYTLSEGDYRYLIKQAERVQELEKENAGLHDILAQIEYQEKDKLLAENKRYREAIKGAIGKFNRN